MDLADTAERADADWARLRHLGARRARLVTEATACQQQIADLLGCCWPAVLACAVKPLESTTWLACLGVVVDAGGGTGRPGPCRAGRVHHRRPQAATTSGSHPAVSPHRARLPRRAALTRPGRPHSGPADWNEFDDRHHATARLTDVQQRMIGIIDAMGLTGLVTSIPGLSTVGAATILAETGDLARFASARQRGQHAGLNPAGNTSATFRGKTQLSRRDRPALRLAA